MTEIPIPHGSDLIGTRIRNANIRERTGANIVAAWIDGELQLPPDPDAVIRPNTVLLVTGEHESLEAFSDFAKPARTDGHHDRIVVAGYGEVGQAATEVIEDAGIETITIDATEAEGVDLVGDAGSEATLKEAGIEATGAIVVGLPDDSATLLTVVQARSLNPDIEIVARVGEADATRKALSAGADYVLSVPRVSARMVARELRGEGVLAPASQIRVVRVPATPFAGSTLAESAIYEQTGCRVIAIDDGSGLSSVVDPQRRLTGDEQLTIVGSDEAIQEFRKQFDVSTTEA